MDEPECVLTDAEVAQLVEEQAGFASPSVAFLAEGLDSRAYAVTNAGTAWVFRFPKRAEVARRLAREIALLPVIAPRLPLAVPRFEVIGRGSATYPHPFVGYRRLHGEPALALSFADTDGIDEVQAGARLAHFLATLHAVPLAEVAALGIQLEGDDAGEDDVATRRAEAASGLALLGIPEAQRGLAVLAAPMPAARERVLVHADCFPEHVLVEAGVPTGVIDWGDVAIGDPAVDLAGIAYWLGGQRLEAAVATYATARGLRAVVVSALVARARAFAACRAAEDLAFGQETGQPAYVEAARAALRHL